MSKLRAFRALRYDPKRVELGRVLVPPYDVVSPRERELFYALDPHNAIRLELTRRVEDEGTTDYRYVAETLQAWRDDGALRLDPQPCLYGLRQRFRDPGAAADEASDLSTRDGFFGLVRLEDYDRRIIRPHERTLSGPKADRLKMLRASRANLSPVFFLYEDPELELSDALRAWLDAEPGIRARDQSGVENTLVPLRARSAQRQAIDFLSDRPLVIADGHHRYETALAYRDECRAEAAARGTAPPDAPYEFLLGYFANAYAPGSLLLPIHRVLRERSIPAPSTWRERLSRSGWREEAVSLAGAEAIGAALRDHLEPLTEHIAFAADDGGSTLRVFSRPKRPDDDLSIRVIHDEVLHELLGLDEERLREGAVAFPKQAAEAAEMVRRGEGSCAIYLNPLRPEDVFRVTGAGQVLPQKSTFFFPKLPSGLLFRLHEEGS